jgi:hypothetical protein
MGDGEHQQAYWVKQLAKGQVAGLPREYVPGQTPFVTEVYASPTAGQEDVLGPVHAMSGWLWSLLTGPATHYGTLLKHIEVTNDWGVVGEVLRFRQLEHHLSDLCLQIAHHKCHRRYGRDNRLFTCYHLSWSDCHKVCHCVLKPGYDIDRIDSQS